MDKLELLEQRRKTLADGWRNLAEHADASGNVELRDAAREQLDLLERPRPGDWVASFTKALGIPQCDKCKKRQAAMNAVDMSRPAPQVIRDLFLALLQPDT